ncbi:MAG: diguanylate cyclase [Acidobacteria bacterium]|nr:diguanylate cyclase [Acidobacteriota bacterium]MCB9396965.1 diguanylate cyclase [Acidobacteriota bacterium]
MDSNVPEAKPLIPSTNDELEKPKILVVDESSANMVAVETLLAKVDVNLFEAIGASEALAIIPKHDFALILVRGVMPDISGFQLLHELQSGNQPVPCAVMLLVHPDEIPDPLPFQPFTGFLDFGLMPLDETFFLAKVHLFLQLHRYRRGWEKELLKRKNLEEKLRASGNGEENAAFIANRRYFQHQFLVEWRRMLREYKPFTLVMIDIDYFEGYREQYGAQAADHLVLKIGHAIRNSISRVSDFVARLEKGGFVCVLPNTDVEGSSKVAKRIKKNVDFLGMENSAGVQKKTVTVSIGVANVITSPHIQPKQFIDLADQALFRAKKRGGNHIEIVEFK